MEMNARPLSIALERYKERLNILDNYLTTLLTDEEKYKNFKALGYDLVRKTHNGIGEGIEVTLYYNYGDRHTEKHPSENGCTVFETRYYDDASSVVTVSNEGTLQKIELDTYTFVGNRSKTNSYSVCFDENELVKGISFDIPEDSYNGENVIGFRLVSEQYAVIQMDNGDLFLAIYKDGIYKPVVEIRKQYNFPKYGLSVKDIEHMERKLQDFSIDKYEKMVEAYLKGDFTKYKFRPLPQNDKLLEYINTMLNIPLKMTIKLSEQLDWFMGKTSLYSPVDRNIADDYKITGYTKSRVKQKKMK